MKLTKIKALMYLDFLQLIRVKYRFVDILYFPVTTIIIWGLFAEYAKDLAFEAGAIVLIINIFWSFAQLAQSTSNMLMMEDVWSGSLRQIMLSGISEYEYIIARLITSSILSVGVMLIMFGLAALFGLNFFSSSMLILTLITLVGSLALSVSVASLILYLGREYGFLAWSLLQAFIVLSAPFFPKEIFPKIILYISYVMPFTAIFEAARQFSVQGAVNPMTLVWGAVVVSAYFILSWPLYRISFRKAKRTGTLARMD